MGNEEVLCPICDGIIPIVHPEVAQCSGCGRRFDLDWDADCVGDPPHYVGHLSLVFDQLGAERKVFPVY